MLTGRGVLRVLTPLVPDPLDFRGTGCTVANMNASFTPPRSFSELIERWPTMADFSRETNQPYERVKRWRAINSIKPKYWPSVKAAAWARGMGWVDDALLARLAATAAVDAA